LEFPCVGCECRPAFAPAGRLLLVAVAGAVSGLLDQLADEDVKDGQRAHAWGRLLFARRSFVIVEIANLAERRDPLAAAFGCRQ